MARKTVEVTITAEGRDHGKKFVITEMSAMKAERWGIRAAMAMSKADLNIDPQLLAAGLGGIAVVGLKGLSGANFNEVEPLLAELMTCVQFVGASPSGTEVRRDVGEDDFEEISTLLKIRYEAFSLTTGFSRAAPLLTMIQGRLREAGESLSTLTSPLPSEP